MLLVKKRSINISDDTIKLDYQKFSNCDKAVINFETSYRENVYSIGVVIPLKGTKNYWISLE